MTVSALVNKVTRGRLRPPVGWMSALGGGTLAGMGFTVSLLVASVAFTGVELKEATLGVLTAAVVAALLTWLVFQIDETAAVVTSRSGAPGPVPRHRGPRRSRR